MSPHDSSSIVPATRTGTPNSTSSILRMSPFTSQPIDLDNGPSASSPYPTPEEASYPFEHVSEDMSLLDDSEPEDDLSSILNALTVSSIKNYARFHHQSDIRLPRRSQFLKTLRKPKNSCAKLFPNARVHYISPSLRMLPCKRHC
jgi:hypothetical protein